MIQKGIFGKFIDVMYESCAIKISYMFFILFFELCNARCFLEFCCPSLAALDANWGWKGYVKMPVFENEDSNWTRKGYVGVPLYENHNSISVFQVDESDWKMNIVYIVRMNANKNIEHKSMCDLDRRISQ